MTQGKPKKVLLIERDLLTRSLYSRYLKMKGYRVIAAASAEEALSAAPKAGREWFAMIGMDTPPGLVRSMREKGLKFDRKILDLKKPVLPAHLLDALA